MVDFYEKYNIALGHSTAYYPQGNDLEKSSKKSLINIIKKMLEANKINWHRKLINALWADRVSSKKSIGMSPFELVYGTEANLLLPLELATNKLRTVIEDDIYKDGLEKRNLYLSRIEEEREEIIDHITQH